MKCLIFTLPFLSAACVMAETDIIPDPDMCGAAPFGPYAGQHINEVPAELKDRELIRILPPMSIVTMDFVIERLNVHLDDNGHLIDLKCG